MVGFPGARDEIDRNLFEKWRIHPLRAEVSADRKNESIGAGLRVGKQSLVATAIGIGSGFHNHFTFPDQPDVDTGGRPVEVSSTWVVIFSIASN